MRSVFSAELVLLLCWAPARAGIFDQLEILTNHLLSGGPGKDGIPAVDAPTFDEGMNRQIGEAIEKRGKGSVESLLSQGDIWEVK